MKRIVICCDGTWNNPDETDAGLLCPTNVEKIAQLVSPSGADANGDQIPQVIFYHDGVGNGDAGEKVGGGAFGAGLSQIIEDCYRFLANNYEAGDELFFFGFSRGAYTARSLIGFIHNSGLLKKNHLDKFSLAYQLYRNRSNETAPNSNLATTFINQFCWPNISIHFLGVWDTVGSLGVPDFILSKLLASDWNFHDISLSPIVESAYQALAIDEKRSDFKPCLWTLPAGANSNNFEQVWFSGVHCDVGGGYPSDPTTNNLLSDITLSWMINKAQACGLNFDMGNLTLSPNPLAAIHDSKTGFFAIRPTYVRPVNPAVIHQSAAQRKATPAANYNPENWPANPTLVP